MEYSMDLALNSVVFIDILKYKTLHAKLLSIVWQVLVSNPMIILS